MTKEREFSYIAENEGRVDLISSRVLSIPRSVFSYPSMSIMVDGKAVRKSERIKEGSKVEIKYTEEVMEGLEKEDIPLSVLYEDDDILVIDKAQGMSVHPGAGNWSGTVANALLGLYGEDFETGDDSMRPGIVHRLDKDTSGVMVIAKTKEAHLSLTTQFSTHSNEKYYLALSKASLPRAKAILTRGLSGTGTTGRSSLLQIGKVKERMPLPNTVSWGRESTVLS